MGSIKHHAPLRPLSALARAVSVGCFAGLVLFIGNGHALAGARTAAAASVAAGAIGPVAEAPPSAPGVRTKAPKVSVATRPLDLGKLPPAAFGDWDAESR